MSDSEMTVVCRAAPWNKAKLIGHKPPLKLREIRVLRTRLEMAGKTKEPALLNLAVDSKLRGGDLVQLRVNDVARGGEVLTRASVIQQKTHESVRLEPTDPTRLAIPAWIAKAGLSSGSYPLPSRQHESLHVSVRQYAWIVKRRVGLTGRNPREYATHSLRRTRATPIHRPNKSLRTVQLLLGHRKPESTVKAWVQTPVTDQRAAPWAGAPDYHGCLPSEARAWPSDPRPRPSRHAVKRSIRLRTKFRNDCHALQTRRSILRRVRGSHARARASCQTAADGGRSVDIRPAHPHHTAESPWLIRRPIPMTDRPAALMS